VQPRLSKTAEKPKYKSGVPRYIESVHAAYTPHRDDDDFVQPRALIRKVMDNGQRAPGSSQSRSEASPV